MNDDVHGDGDDVEDYDDEEDDEEKRGAST